MIVMMFNFVEKQLVVMCWIIGKYLVVFCWQEICDYYNQMMECEWLMVCFYVQLKQCYVMMCFEEMNDVECEWLVCVIDELCGVFLKCCQVGVSEYVYISFLIVSQCCILFMYVGLIEKEFNQLYW